jgi:hypothetical protein
MSNERDPELTKLYREHSREEPPPALDAAILAAAHRAVASAPRKAGDATRPQRWWMPLAAAAAVGIVAIGVIQQMPKETALDATSVATAPSSAPAPAPPAAPPPPAQAPAAAMEQRPVPADTGALAKKQKAGDAVATPPPPPPPALTAAKPSAGKAMPAPPPAQENKLVAEPAPVPFPAEPSRRKADTTSEAKRDMPAEQPTADARKDALREERQNAAPAVAAAPPPPAAPAPAARMRAQSQTAAGAIAQPKSADQEMSALARDPEAWITRIRKLRDEGNTAQALRELKAFRALVPDAERRLPPDLRTLQP